MKQKKDKLNIENRYSIINSYIEKLIMEVSGTYERDKLLDIQKTIKQLIWHERREKEWQRRNQK